VGTINPTLPTLGQPNVTEDPDLLNALTAILNEFNGNVDEANLKAAVKTALGLSDGTTSRRGKAIVPGTDTRANAAYGLLGTPDQVTVDLPANGLLGIAYEATWRESVASAGRAAIFLNGNQLKFPVQGQAAPQVQETDVNLGGGGFTNIWTPLSTNVAGIRTVIDPDSGVSYTGDVATGQPIAGGPCYVFAAAGTYVVSVQYKASAGQVDVKDRKLWVWTMGF
jgi:hypothetical protein